MTEAPGPAGLAPLLERAESDEAVLAVLLFGSVARGEGTPASDVDVCLVLWPEARERPSEVRLRYLSRSDLDVQVLQDLPIYVRKRVFGEGRVLLVKDEDLLYDVAWRTAKEWGDFQPFYEAYLREVLHGRP